MPTLEQAPLNADIIPPVDVFNDSKPDLARTPEVDPQTVEHLAQLSIEQAIRERGDRQLPDEPNRGFRIERLEGDRPNQTVSRQELLPDSDDYRAKEFARQFLDGTTPIDIVPDAWSGVRMGKPGFVVYFPVAASKYEAAVAAGDVPEGLFDPKGTAIHTDGAEALDGLVDSEQKAEAVEAYYHKQPNAVNRNYIDDLEGLTKAEREELKEVTEAFEFFDGGRSVRLLNFSQTRLDSEQLRKAANVLRSAADKSGSLERLYTIAIMPENHSTMQKEVKKSDGTTEILPVNAYQDDHLMAISEWSIQPPDKRKPRPASIKDFMYDKLLPGEPAEGPGSPRTNVSGGDFEGTLAHEITHHILHGMEYSTPLPGPAKSLYGRHNRTEHIAELGAAEHMGGEEALEVPEDQREALNVMYTKKYGSEDGGVTYKRPLGPHFVVCKEIDITQGPLSMRQRHPGRPLAAEVTYRLNPDA
jgi:hypothetical protein